MMERIELEILSNLPVNEAGNVFEMRLDGRMAEQLPGQFVDIALEGLFLRRPISVSDWTPEALTLLYKVVGKGTKQMSQMTAGQTLELLTGLGRGFDTDAAQGRKPLLVGGGIGAAPLYLLARKLLERGVKPTVILGFNSASEIILEQGFRDLGVETFVTTADGSYGIKGFVTDALKKADADFFYACGPMPMLKALLAHTDMDGELSLEERMGCGTGICMGCTCNTAEGPKRVCKDGPVFKRKEIEATI